MNIQYLEMLAARLEQINPNTDPIIFDIETWFYQEDPGCGTAACAIGIACMMPEFQALGLSLQDDVTCPQFRYPHYNGSSGWLGVVGFFDFVGAKERSISNYLFDPSGYDPHEPPTAAMVAARIRDEVAAAKERAGV